MEWIYDFLEEEEEEEKRVQEKHSRAPPFHMAPQRKERVSMENENESLESHKGRTRHIEKGECMHTYIQHWL